MKHLKMLGLAALAAFALSAVIGVGTASAKVCSGMGSNAACAGAHGKEYKGQVTAKTSAAKLTSTFFSVSCTSEIVDTITNSFTGTGTFFIGFSGCTSSVGSCSVGQVGGHSHSTFAATTAPNGTLTIATVKLEVSCKNPSKPAEGVVCIYDASNVAPAVFSAMPPRIEVSANLAVQAGSHASCSQATWEGEYIVTAPTTLYLT
jgi:hypothetical protein